MDFDNRVPADEALRDGIEQVMTDDECVCNCPNKHTASSTDSDVTAGYPTQG